MAHKQSPPLPKIFNVDELLNIISDLKANSPYDNESLLRSSDPDTVHAAKSAELGRMGALQAIELILTLKL